MLLLVLWHYFFLFPFQAVIVPLFQWVNRFYFNDTYIGFAIPFLISSFGIFLIRQGMDMLPKEIIDGSNEMTKFITIVMPLAKSFVATQAIIKFMWSWNEFFGPLVITNEDKMKVVTIGLQSYKNDYFIEYNLLTTASILSIVPMIIVFFCFPKRDYTECCNEWIERIKNG